MSCRITSADGNYIKAEIEACIEKGWFKPEDNWTCYRRNYFVVKCSYDLKPAHFAQPLSLTRSNSPGLAEEILEFAMCISAEADNGAKTVELVQHTPKRDKGPQEKPKRQTLQPCPASHFHHPTMAFSTSRFPTGQDYDQTYQSNCIASFERIQFKSATQNNGRRRAAQQFYNLMVDLYAKTRSLSGEASWVKVASRVSVPVVVRGRSPGHYAEERRGNSTSSGPSPSDDSSAESHDGCIPPIGSYTVPDHQHQQHNGYRAPSGSPITDVYSSGRPTVQSFAPPEQRAGQGYAPPEMARPAQPHYGGPLGPIMTNDEDLPMQSTHAGYQFYQSSMFGPTRSG
ncbi:MAG: hypothetical protein M1814_001449 [Vezdaea aestivalis]|nr:MAG: hypothetical protein M1814_001449 [Vezdaea aestivalis]